MTRLELAAVGEVTGGEDDRLPAEEAHGAFGRLGLDAGDAPVVLDPPWCCSGCRRHPARVALEVPDVGAEFGSTLCVRGLLCGGSGIGP